MTQQLAQLGQGQDQLSGGQGRRLQGNQTLVELDVAAGSGDGLLNGIKALLADLALLLLAEIEAGTGLGQGGELQRDQQQETEGRHASQPTGGFAQAADDGVIRIEIGGQKQQPQGHQRQHPVFGHDAAEPQLPTGIKQPERQQLGQQAGEEDEQQGGGNGDKLSRDWSLERYFRIRVGVHWVQELRWRMRLRKRRLQLKAAMPPARGRGAGTLADALVALKLAMERMPASP